MRFQSILGDRKEMQFTLINGHGPPPVLLGDSLAGNKRPEWDGLLPACRLGSSTYYVEGK